MNCPYPIKSIKCDGGKRKMNTNNLFFRRAFLPLLGVLIMTLLVSCGFGPALNYCNEIDQAPVKALTDSDPGTNPL
jgi:hypothetical protein